MSPAGVISNVVIQCRQASLNSQTERLLLRRRCPRSSVVNSNLYHVAPLVADPLSCTLIKQEVS